jgi:hypothetical protein
MNRTALQIGDELYGLAPQAFTAARDAYIAEAKGVGNRTLATELAGWKRPSVAAGLVNLVALRRPDSVQGLIELGQAIREAQGNVTPIQLRDLSAQRRKELDAVVALAQSLAAERGDAAPSRAVLAEVESTFAAAMVDDAAASLVKSGRVIKSLSYSGFGQPAGDASADWGVFAASAPQRAAPVDEKAADKTAEKPTGKSVGKSVGKKAAEEEAEQTAVRAAAEAAQRRAAAEERMSRARQLLADTTTAQAEAERHVQDLADQIAELSHQLDTAQRDARAARQARLAAERDLASAERILHRYS